MTKKNTRTKEFIFLWYALNFRILHTINIQTYATLDYKIEPTKENLQS